MKPNTGKDLLKVKLIIDCDEDWSVTQTDRSENHGNQSGYHLTDCDKLLVTLDGAQYQEKNLLNVKLIDCDEDWLVAQSD
jgi:hypothetical protein